MGELKQNFKNIIPRQKKAKQNIGTKKEKTPRQGKQKQHSDRSKSKYINNTLYIHELNTNQSTRIDRMDKKARSDYWLFTKDTEHTKKRRGQKRHDVKAISSRRLQPC